MLASASITGPPLTGPLASANEANNPFRDTVGSGRPGGGVGGVGGGGGGGGSHHYHSHLHHHHHQGQRRALWLLKVLAAVPGVLGVIYSINCASAAGPPLPPGSIPSSSTSSTVTKGADGSMIHGEDSFSQDDVHMPQRTDFWMASMWAGLAAYWGYVITSAIIQRQLQSKRAATVVLRVAMLHLVSWTIIGILIHVWPPTEPIRPWIVISFGQAALLFTLVYLPLFLSPMHNAGWTRFANQVQDWAIEDDFMGEPVGWQSMLRLLVLPFGIVGLCSWMLIITRGEPLDGGVHEKVGDMIRDAMKPAGGHGFGAPVRGGGGGGGIDDGDYGSYGGGLLAPITGADSSSLLKTGDDGRQRDPRIIISMIVLSSATPQGYANRQMFRQTTLKLFPSPRNKVVLVNYRFILGYQSVPAVDEEIKQEHQRYGDLLIVRAADAIDRKSLKLYKAIEWADRFEFDYLVKTDDDVLVRMDTLASDIVKLGRKKYYWSGLVFKNMPNNRMDDLDIKEMPKYTDGTLITLSREVVRLLGVPAPRLHADNHAQSLGIWLHGYGIQPVHDIRIQPGALVCEEDLIAKHFDLEPSLAHQPRDTPLEMMTRIQQIKADIKSKKQLGISPATSTLTICNPMLQKRCALCYSCANRASNWKWMGFDCKQGGVVVGERYRKPGILESLQMDEIVNRPATGISDKLDMEQLKVFNSPSGAVQQQQQQQEQEQEQQQQKEDGEQLSDEQKNEGEGEPGVQTSNQEGQQDVGKEIPSKEDADDADDAEGEEVDGSSGSEEEQGEEDEGGDEEEEDDEEEGDEEDESHDGAHDESELTLSDNFVENLDRRHHLD
ncbi:Lactosylceramide 1,3-N-acetyl-beta-D-glucosaminyltransferase [Actinomortierella ambigua]|nr:Lactosylceramide 1,3-N-acetyl-beta-D-glucosaminyltransferase [Actinomortierella ambigua]